MLGSRGVYIYVRRREMDSVFKPPFHFVFRFEGDGLCFEHSFFDSFEIFPCGKVVFCLYMFYNTTLWIGK